MSTVRPLYATLVLCLLSSPALAQDNQEPNDDFDAATALTSGSSVTGTIHENGDHDVATANRTVANHLRRSPSFSTEQAALSRLAKMPRWR